MNSSKEMLSSLLKNTQKEQQTISTTLGSAMAPGLRKALEAQLRQYESIEDEIFHLASQRGWDLAELDPAVRFLTDMFTRMQLSWGVTDSRIAGMLIETNTRIMIRELKNTHRFSLRDDGIRQVSRRLLDCEKANIRQMQSFL